MTNGMSSWYIDIVRAGPNCERLILTSVGKELDSFRKFTPKTGKRNGTSRVPYESTSLSDWDWDEGMGGFGWLVDSKALSFWTGPYATYFNQNNSHDISIPYRLFSTGIISIINQYRTDIVDHEALVLNPARTMIIGNSKALKYLPARTDYFQ